VDLQRLFDPIRRCDPNRSSDLDYQSERIRPPRQARRRLRLHACRDRFHRILGGWRLV
jgi:hypothetical protein